MLWKYSPSLLFTLLRGFLVYKVDYYYYFFFILLVFTAIPSPHFEF